MMPDDRKAAAAALAEDAALIARIDRSLSKAPVRPHHQQAGSIGPGVVCGMLMIMLVLTLVGCAFTAASHAIDALPLHLAHRPY